MFKDFRTWLIIGLVLLVVYLILSRPSAPDPTEITILKQRDKAKQVKIDSLADRNRAILSAYQKDVQSWDSARSVFKTQLNAKQDRQVKIKTVVLQTVDTMPVVKEYLLRQDSIIEDLSKRTNQLEFELSSTTKSLLGIQANMEQELKFTQDQYKIALQEAEVYRKGWRKEQRKTKGWKVAAVAGTVLGIVCGIQL